MAQKNRLLTECRALCNQTDQHAVEARILYEIMEALLELQSLKEQSRDRADSAPTRDIGSIPTPGQIADLQHDKLVLQHSVGIQSYFLILFIFGFFYALLGFHNVCVS